MFFIICAQNKGTKVLNKASLSNVIQEPKNPYKTVPMSGTLYLLTFLITSVMDFFNKPIYQSTASPVNANTDYINLPLPMFTFNPSGFYPPMNNKSTDSIYPININDYVAVL